MNSTDVTLGSNRLANSRITRRLFAIFFLFALLPVSILSYVAVETTSSASRTQSTQALEAKTKNLSYLVLNRLVFAEQTLGLTVATGREPGGGENSALTRLAYDNFQMTLPQQQQLAAGGYVVSVTTLVDPTLKLIKAIEPDRLEAGMLMLPLTESIILGEAESRDLSIESCVFSEHGIPLYSSNPMLCAELGATTNALAGHKGSLGFTLVDSNYQASYRTLFLQDRYQGPNWKVAIIQRHDELFSAASLFRNNFLLLALTVILSLSLVSIQLIRRRMAPLGEIMAGIQRVTEQRYDKPVLVNSNDEFDDLAAALNSMSHKVSSQLDMLQSLAELDQLTLTRSGRKMLLQAVLENTADLLKVDAAGIVLLDFSENGNGASLQTCNQQKQVSSRAITLKGYQQEQLRHEDLWLTSEGGRHNDIFAALPDEINAVHLLPISTENDINVIMLLGYPKREQQNSEQQSAISTYVDRIAVALANADSEARLYRQAHFDSLTAQPLVDAGATEKQH